jgi:hypothetical protein
MRQEEMHYRFVSLSSSFPMRKKQSEFSPYLLMEQNTTAKILDLRLKFLVVVWTYPVALLLLYTACC